MKDKKFTISGVTDRAEIMETRFLNVDLDLRAGGDLRVLVHALAPTLFLINRAEGLLTFELGEEMDSAERVMRAMVAAVRALPAPARALWDGCARRTMNVGVQAGGGPRRWATGVSTDVLTALAEIGAELVFTVYGADEG
ncbi:MAG: hypothetical protein JWM10_342 [Myxococcaceae bacterium]|nr:hypothetical protein [Myxococcaceae bacterium]